MAYRYHQVICDIPAGPLNLTSAAVLESWDATAEGYIRDTKPAGRNPWRAFHFPVRAARACTTLQSPCAPIYSAQASFAAAARFNLWTITTVRMIRHDW